MHARFCRVALTSVGICSDTCNANLWQNRHNPTMKHSLTVVTACLLAVLALLALQRSGVDVPLVRQAKASGDSPAAKAKTATAAPSNGRGVAQVDGNVLLARAAAEVKQLPTLEAKVRLHTNMLGQELAGSGTYYQLQRSPDTLFKLELKLQVANQVSSLLHVSDGRFLWTRRDLPTSKFLARVDQRRVQAALTAANRLPPPGAGTGVLALGGLGRLLDTLCGNFQFGPPREDDLGGAKVWTLLGTWRPEALAALWPEKAAAIQQGEKIALDTLPLQLPSHVVVVLSRDPALPLFPQRIDYQKANEDGESHSLVQLELFDVRRNLALDPRLFDYKPGDQEVQEQTEEFLKRVGL
jgi:hypothetical protein